MRYLKLSLPAGIIAAGLLFNATATFAKPEYMKKEKKACTYCHTSNKGGKTDADLTDAGKFYSKNHTLEGFTPKN